MREEPEYFRGKVVGRNWYVHRDAILSLPRDIMGQLIPMISPDVGKYDILKIKFRNDFWISGLTYLYVIGWDTLDEPLLHAYITWSDKGGFKTRWVSEASQQVYHHKWMMIPRELASFDWDASRVRSNIFAHPVLVAHAKIDKHFKSKVGKKTVWDSLMKEVEDYDNERKTVLPIINGE